MQITDKFTTPETVYDVVTVTVQIMPEWPEQDQSILVYWLKAVGDTGTEATHFLRLNITTMRGPLPIANFPTGE